MASNKCPKCGMNLNDDCIFVWKCPECGKAFKINFSKLEQVQEWKRNNVGNHLIKCSSCGYALDDGNEHITCKCSSCGNVSEGNLAHFIADDLEDKIIEDTLKHIDGTTSKNTVSINLVRCPECGQEVKDTETSCPECGYPMAKRENKIEMSKKSCVDGLRSMRTKVIIFAIICFIVSGIFFAKGHNVKNDYYNSDYSTLNKNAYVGGDAYNYIINGTYFTGYSVIAAATLICGMILISNSIMISIKVKEYE